MASQDAESRRDAMIGVAVSAWSKKAERMDEERKEARTLMDEMIAESKAREEHERERMEAAAPWQMALSGGMTGASIGGLFGGPGAAIGAGIGAVGGGIFGAMQPESVSRVAPYVAMAGQGAQAYQGQQSQQGFMRRQENRQQDYMNLLRGGGSTGGSTGGSLPRFENLNLRLRPPTIG